MESLKNKESSHSPENSNPKKTKNDSDREPFMSRFLESPYGGVMMSDTTTPIIVGERDDTIKAA